MIIIKNILNFVLIILLSTCFYEETISYRVDKANKNENSNTINETKGEVEWVRQLGSSVLDRGYDINISINGNILVTGRTDGNFDGNQYIGGSGADILIVNFFSNGDKNWTKQIGTTQSDVGWGISSDSSGNIYVIGPTDGVISRSSFGSKDGYLISYSNSSMELWRTQIGSSAIDTGNAVVIGQSGNIYLGGNTDGNIDNQTNSGNTDIFFMKYDSSGAKLWSKIIGTNLDEQILDIYADSNEDIILIGYTNGNLDNYSNLGGSDIFIIKYDASGQKIFSNQFGSSGNDIVQHISIDKLNSIYLTGYTNGNLDGNGGFGNDDIFLIKLDGNGNKLWTRQLGTSGNERSYGVVTDSFNDIYITGNTDAGFSFDNKTGLGSEDIFLVKYNTEGNKIWSKIFGTSSSDIGYELAIDSSNYIYITGSTTGDFETGKHVGNEDLFILKIK